MERRPLSPKPQRTASSYLGQTPDQHKDVLSFYPFWTQQDKIVL